MCRARKAGSACSRRGPSCRRDLRRPRWGRSALPAQRGGVTRIGVTREGIVSRAVALDVLLPGAADRLPANDDSGVREREHVRSVLDVDLPVDADAPRGDFPAAQAGSGQECREPASSLERRTRIAPWPGLQSPDTGVGKAGSGQDRPYRSRTAPSPILSLAFPFRDDDGAQGEREAAEGLGIGARTLMEALRGQGIHAAFRSTAEYGRSIKPLRSPSAGRRREHCGEGPLLDAMRATTVILQSSTKKEDTRCPQQ